MTEPCDTAASMDGFSLLVVRAKGQSSEPFFPGIVKSCSSTVDRDVFRAENLMLLVPDILLPLTVDPVDLPVSSARRCAARRPSLIATAVCTFEFVWFRCGSGTNLAESGVEICKSDGSWSLANVLEISASLGAYLSARC